MSDARPGLLFIVNSLGVGGAERQVVTLLNHLDVSQFRLHLAHLRPPATLRAALETQRLDALVSLDVARGIDFGAAWQLARLVATQRIDVIVCTNRFSLLYGSLARSLGTRAVRLATVFHSTQLLGRRERAEMVLYRRLFERCDLLVYVCEQQRASWQARGLRAVRDTVIYNGIDAARFADRFGAERKLALRRELGLDPAACLIGQCGRLSPEKGLPDLIAAAGLLRQQGAPVQLLLIGDGAERDALSSLARAQGLEAAVRITGLLDDVRLHVATCDIMTLASHTETFSLAALEAMALGRPMVLTEVGGAAELVAPPLAGRLCPPRDVRSLARALSIFVQDPAERARCGEAAARRVRERFTLDGMVAGFTDALGRLAEPTTALNVRRS